MPIDNVGLVADLYKAHALGLIRMALLLVGDQPTAEDAVPDAFLSLQRGQPRRALTVLARTITRWRTSSGGPSCSGRPPTRPGDRRTARPGDRVQPGRRSREPVGPPRRNHRRRAQHRRSGLVLHGQQHREGGLRPLATAGRRALQQAPRGSCSPAAGCRPTCTAGQRYTARSRRWTRRPPDPSPTPASSVPPTATALEPLPSVRPTAEPSPIPVAGSGAPGAGGTSLILVKTANRRNADRAHSRLESLS